MILAWGLFIIFGLFSLFGTVVAFQPADNNKEFNGWAYLFGICITLSAAQYIFG